jgi:lipooligosaccharide transport system permease protein
MTLAPEPRASLTFRVIPPGMYSGRGHVVLERAFKVYRRGWMLIFSGFFEPLFYLFSFGTGLHSLVGTVIGPGGHPVKYTVFIAPALLASSAMNGAIYDSTMNVFFKMKYGKIYDGMLATSLGPMDVAMGEISWALIRGGLYSTGFLVVMAVMGLTGSWWAAAMLPAALLIAFAFGALGMAVTTYMRTIQDLDMIQVVAAARRRRVRRAAVQRTRTAQRAGRFRTGRARRFAAGAAAGNHARRRPGTRLSDCPGLTVSPARLSPLEHPTNAVRGAKKGSPSATTSPPVPLLHPHSRQGSRRPPPFGASCARGRSGGSGTRPRCPASATGSACSRRPRWPLPWHTATRHRTTRSAACCSSSCCPRSCSARSRARSPTGSTGAGR